MECPGLPGIWAACAQTTTGLRPFEVHAFALVGGIVAAFVVISVLLMGALVTWTLTR